MPIADCADSFTIAAALNMLPQRRRKRIHMCVFLWWEEGRRVMVFIFDTTLSAGGGDLGQKIH